MSSKNICKFPNSMLDTHTLSVLCFVRETDRETMRIPYTLKANRMLLVTEKEGAVCIDGRTHPLRTGMLLFCFTGETVAFEGEDGFTYMYVDFEGTRGEELLRRFDITPLSRFREGQDGLIPLWQESLFRSSEGTVDLAAESVLLFCFSRFSGRESSEDGAVAKTVEITEENFRDPELGIGRIAAELSYHPKYLSHLFKKKTGVAYSEYLRSVRLKYATALFDRGIDSVKNVALLSGFSDPLYFSRVFKASVGISPKDYIAQRARGE